MNYIFKTLLIVAVLLLVHSPIYPQNILMFVSQEETYYSEYIVMKTALEASGYNVDVRSAINGQASIYMIAEGMENEASINGVADNLDNSSYLQFTEQFENSFGQPWNETFNAIPNSIDTQGSIIDVTNITNYDALVVVGGIGALDYRFDGDYSSQGSVSALEVQAAAEKLNDLALDALINGKPVLAQCHGASLASFWRIPETSGPDEEWLGYSLLKGQYSTGYPNDTTATDLSTLDVTYKADDRVVVSSPNSSLNDNNAGEYKIITSRDWYPQTVAFAARTLLNIIESYPSTVELLNQVSVLLIHGGEIDENNCNASNKDNDIPCNYGTGSNIPADYTDVLNLLNSNSINDNFNFSVNNINLTSVSLPFDLSNKSTIDSYISTFDVVLFFKHWSTGITDELENALVDYADNGGGVVALHHGLYNDINGTQNKDILVNELFGVESAAHSWSATLADYLLYSTNYGHFISTYGIEPTNDALQAPAIWNANELPTSTNPSFSYYPTINIYDEIYENMSYVSGEIFGRDIGEITPLFSNDQNPSAQAHTSAFVKYFNPTGDESIGRLVYMEPGERKESININHQYGQIIRNSIAWAAPNNNAVLSVELSFFEAYVINNGVEIMWVTSSEESNDYFEVFKSLDGENWFSLKIIDGSEFSNEPVSYSLIDDNPFPGLNYYRLSQVDFDGEITSFKVISAFVPTQKKQFIVYPNPSSSYIKVVGIGVENIKIKDIHGKTVISSDNKYVDITKLSKGSYFLILSHKGGVESHIFQKK